MQGKPPNSTKEKEPPDELRPPFIWVGKKDLKKVQERAWDAGWRPVKKKNGVMWFGPEGTEHVMLHESSSDHHALDNAVSDFRKAGLDI